MSKDTAKGYWLIEPDELAHLIASPRLQPLAESVLGWLAAELTERLNLTAHGIRVEVIHAQYLGPPYPCLGVQGDEIPEALEKRIELEVSRILQQTPLTTFLQTLSAA